MNRKSLFFIFALLFSFPLFCQEKLSPGGKQLCDFVFYSLEKENLKPEISYLTKNHTNDFPYNISVKLLGNQSDESFFTIQIKMEDAFFHTDLISELCKKINRMNLSYPVLLLITFGDDISFPFKNTSSGIDYYFSSSDFVGSSSISAGLLLNLENDRTSFIFGSNGKTANSNLIKCVFQAYDSNRLLKRFKSFCISHLYLSPIFYDKDLSSFLENDISSVKLNFSTDISEEKIYSIIIQILTSMNDITIKNDSTHWVMLSLFKRNFWITERSITKGLIIILFSTLLFLSLLGFINRSLQMEAWKTIKKIWHIPIVIYLLSVCCYFLGNEFCKLTEQILEIKLNYVSRLLMIIPMTFLIQFEFIVSLLYVYPDFKKRSIDYLILISVTINLYFFCFIDISFFTIFLFEFFIAIICIFFQSNIAHTFLFLGYFLPFIPYLVQINEESNLTLLNNYVNNNITFPLFFFMVSIPLFLIFFRIITHMNIRWFEKEHDAAKKSFYNILVSASILITITALTIIFIPWDVKTFVPEETNNKKTVITNSPKNNINLLKEDIYLFGDKIINLAIESDVPLEYCDLKITSEYGQPVLFSDYDYFTPYGGTAIFEIPVQPPQNMIFSYGENHIENKIKLTAIYKDEMRNMLDDSDTVYYLKEEIQLVSNVESVDK